MGIIKMMKTKINHFFINLTYKFWLCYNTNSVCEGFGRDLADCGVPCNHGHQGHGSIVNHLGGVVVRLVDPLRLAVGINADDARNRHLAVRSKNDCRPRSEGYGNGHGRRLLRQNYS